MTVPTPTVEGAPKRGKSAELIAKAATTRIGAAARLDNEETLLQDTSSSSSSSSAQRDLFVVPVSGTRGLHVQDVEYVIILSPPKTMDEYLHMAGRTGRSGNRSKGGTVISLVNFDEMKRLKSWETALGIEFEVEYQ
jgi:superfamily II DNA/RNA helicase